MTENIPNSAERQEGAAQDIGVIELIAHYIREGYLTPEETAREILLALAEVELPTHALDAGDVAMSDEYDAFSIHGVFVDLTDGFHAICRALAGGVRS